MTLGLFDAHIQADGLVPSDLSLMSAFGVRAALLPAHDGFGPTSAERLLEHFRDLVHVQAPRVLRAGIRPYVALGVPANRIPERDLERVLDLLPRFCTQARVVALGQIGLGTGSAREEEAFARQLDLANELGLPVLVALPLQASGRLLKRSLALVNEHALPPERVLFARARPEQLATILGCGHWAHVSLRAGPHRLEQLLEYVRRSGTTRLVLGSEAGDGASDILAVARFAEGLERRGLSMAVIRKATAENALDFLRIDRGCFFEELARFKAAR